MPDFSDPRWQALIQSLKEWLSESYWDGVIGITAVLLVIITILALPKRVQDFLKRMLLGALTGAAPFLVIAAVKLRESIIAGQPMVPGEPLRQALIAMIIPSIAFGVAKDFGCLLVIIMAFLVELIWAFFKLNPNSPSKNAIFFGSMSSFFFGVVIWVLIISKGYRESQLDDSGFASIDEKLNHDLTS